MARRKNNIVDFKKHAVWRADAKTAAESLYSFLAEKMGSYLTLPGAPIQKDAEQVYYEPKVQCDKINEEADHRNDRPEKL